MVWRLILLWLLVATSTVHAQPRAEKSLNALADSFYWAQQERQLQPNLSEKGNAKWLKQLESFDTRLKRASKSQKTSEGKITADMLRTAIHNEKRYIKEGWIQRDVAGSESLLLNIHDAVDASHRKSVGDWRWVISNLRRSAPFVKNYIRLLEKGVASGNMQPKAVVHSAIEQAGMLSSKSALVNPLVELRAELKTALRGKPQLRSLQKELNDALHIALGSHRELKTFLKKKYLPKAPRPGKDPKAYAYFVEKHLGQGHTPKKLESWGRKKVEKIYKEMERTARSIDPKMKSLSHFMKGLENKKSQGYAKPGDVLKTTKSEVAEANRRARKIVAYPRNTLDVRPMPKADARTEDAQYINMGPKSGRFEINTSKELAPARYILSPIATHEHAHHVQGMVAQTKQTLPDFRKEAGVTVYDEGWAMYVDHLRFAKGGYTPHERIGHLQMVLWSAAQMVVDVGINTGTMSKTEAARYMAKNLFTSTANGKHEVARLLNVPGHALSYFVGREAFIRLRKVTKRQLGAHFNERAYHAKLLKSGAMPIGVLKKRMHTWGKQSLAQHNRPSRARVTKKKVVTRAKAKGPVRGR